ncbi:MAG: 2-polyprenyl-3-methyl-5-hydroxy-6-metoxy-1,4-benzoquinol methylase [Salibacteraceae bacterium]|jgi:2-polyprenyl-3-methyl-5-hydroxy-6-metoxy-1,4-benzoquinol methylase|tara:strand:+ start:939 stop:1901 length:963 start_codon:yes stop_codon:yes gene_type:complete
MSCPVCNSEKNTKLLDWKKYEMMRCKSCALIYSTPLPTDQEITDFYQGFLFQQPADFEIDKKLKTRKTELTNLFKLTSNSKGKKLLDYGGGTGAVFKSATELGLDTYYYDLDKKAENFTKGKFGLTDAKIIEDVANTVEKFDYIFCDNVIEHVKYPKELVEMLTRLLNKDGVLIFKTPHGGNTEIYFNPLISIKEYCGKALKYNSVSKTIQGYFQAFWHADPPRHIFSFSKKSMIELVNRSKYSSYTSKVDYYNIPAYNNTITKDFFSKDKRLSPLKSVIVRLILWPIVIIEVLLHIVKRSLISIGIVSAGGLILIIKND